MALKDFFTLTEMKDGLTDPRRVEELVAKMQNEKLNIVNNVGESTRQWSTAASAIAATINKECLDLFIQLDGVFIFNKWLKDAQKFCNVTNDSFVEVSMIALLRALERLNLDKEKLFSSGILITVKNLIGHNSSRIQESARALSDSWNWRKEIDEVGENGNEGYSVEYGRDGNLPVISSDGLEIKKTPDVKSEMSEIQGNTLISLGPLGHAENKTPEVSTFTSVQPPVQGNISTNEELHIFPLEGITSNAPDIVEVFNEKKTDGQRFDMGTDDDKLPNKIQSSPKFVDAVNAGESLNPLTFPTSNGAKKDVYHVKSPWHGKVGTLLPETGMDNSQIRCGGHDEQHADDVAVASEFSKIAMDSKDSDMIGRGSDIDMKCSPESINGEGDKLSESPQKDISAGLNGIENQPDICIRDVEPSQISEAANKSQEITEKEGLCSFDLNKVLSCSEDVEDTISWTASPSHFEGALGWKGTAPSSAFPPASPQKISYGDNISKGVDSDNPKQRNNRFDIDLNMSGGDLIPEKKVPLSSGLSSRDLSVEMSPKISEGLKLDLNFTNDHDLDGHWIQSHASSSSPMHSLLKTFDLNDGASLPCDLSNHHEPYLQKSFSQYENAYGSLKLDDPDITFLGTRVEVNGNDFVRQFMPLQNGKTTEPTMPYAHPSAYAYNGHTTGPPFSFYALGSSTPYMVDARGGPDMGYQKASYPQQQLMMSMNSAPSPVLNEALPLLTNIGLNSGFMSERGNADEGSSSSRTDLQQLRTDLQLSSSSGIGEKRKESDGEWEPYPFSLKLHQPPWK